MAQGVKGSRAPHGTRARYQAGCGCSACRRANSDYQNRRYRKLVAIEWGEADQRSADAAEVREHLRYLVDAGMRPVEIAAECGVSFQTVYAVLAGRRRVHYRTWDRLMGVHLPDGMAPKRREREVSEAPFEAEAVELAALTWPLRRCPDCGEEWPANTDYFVRDRANPDGLKNRCRRCSVKAGSRYYARRRAER